MKNMLLNRIRVVKRSFIKPSFLLMVSLWISQIVVASDVEGFKYQALLTQSNGSIVDGQRVDFRLSIVDRETQNVLYQEAQSGDILQGVVDMTIGSGTPLVGSWEKVEWQKGGLSLKVEFDCGQTGRYELFSNAPLGYVPYAYFAQKVVQPVDSVLTLSKNLYMVHEKDTLVTIKDSKIGIGTTNPQGDVEFGVNRRLHLSSEEWHLGKSGVVSFQARNNVAKPSLTWYDEQGVPHAAMTMYDRSSVDAVHNKEFAIETCNGKGELIPRFTIPYGAQKTSVNFYNSDFTVNGGAFKVGSESGGAVSSYFYGDVVMRKRLGVGERDWATNGFTNTRSGIEVYASTKPAEILVQSSPEHSSSLMLQRGDALWKMENNGDFRILTGDQTVLTATESGNVGIGVEAPQEKLEVEGAVRSTAGFMSSGGAYSIYFEKEEALAEGDLVGVNPSTGKVRKLSNGDHYVGVAISRSDAGYIANYSSNSTSNDHLALVAVLGIVPYSPSQVVIENGVVRTSIGRKVIGMVYTPQRILLQ